MGAKISSPLQLLTTYDGINTMLKYYLDRSGKIPASVHPFVKQEALGKAEKAPKKGKIQVINRLRNGWLVIWRSLSQRHEKP